MAFILTAAVTLLSSILCLLLYRKPQEDYPDINPIDRYLRKHVCVPVQSLVGQRYADCSRSAYTTSR